MGLWAADDHNLISITSLIVLIGGVAMTAGGLVLGWLYSGKRAMDRIDLLTTRQFDLQDKLSTCELEHTRAMVREEKLKADLERVQIRLSTVETKTGIVPQQQYVPGLIIADLSGTILEFSPALTMMTGWMPEEMRGQNIEKMVPPELLAAHRAGFSKAAQAGAVLDPTRKINTEVLDKNGARVPVTISVRKWEGTEGKLTAMLTMRPSAREMPAGSLMSRRVTDYG
jgi:PAS domain S-box-containing protein